jgi:membrane-associated phospholipid phosphatase
MTPRSWFRGRYGATRFRLVDINCLAYLGLIAVFLVFFHKEVPAWPRYSLLHLAIIVASLEIVRLGELAPRGKVLWFLRTFYPVAISLFGWLEVDALSRMLFGDFWATETIIRAERLIFGGSSVAWFKACHRPWLDEVMAFFYNCYYLFVILSSLPLFLKRKYEQALAVLSLGTLVLFTNYVLFYFMPALSPAMADSPNLPEGGTYSGYLFAALTRFLQGNAASRVGTFPSSHISEALIWSLAAFRYNRKLGAVLLAFVPGVVVSTVFMGYHYALDPLFGLLLGGALFPVGLKILKARGEDPVSPPRPEPTLR